MILICMLLLSISMAPPVRADTQAPAEPGGTYRSGEGPKQTAAQLGAALSIPPVPDPAADLTRQKNDDTQAEYSLDSWYAQEAWITDIGLLLYNDFDNDGYFAGFSLSVDADTSYSDADVYLTIDMQRPFQQIESLHTSEIFPLYGQSAADEYQIDIELVSNYSPDQYDLIIELRDAYNHELLDRVSWEDFSNLRALPLESEDYDTSRYEPTYGDQGTDIPFYDDDIRVDEHAGSLGWWMALIMTLSVLARRLRFQHAS